MEIEYRTLRRCVDFSTNWGYGSMKIVNLFSQITTDPTKLRIPTNIKINLKLFSTNMTPNRPLFSIIKIESDLLR